MSGSAGSRCGGPVADQAAVHGGEPDAAAVPGPGPDAARPASEEAVRTLSRQLAEYSQHIQNLNIAEYVELVRNPRRMFVLNMISGIGRGFGIAIGFTLLGAAVLVLLRHLVMLNLPHIGGFIAELVRIVQSRLAGP